MTNRIKPYKKEVTYSYTSGAYATFELILSHPEIVRTVYFRTSYNDQSNLMALCAAKGIPCLVSDKAFNLINQKENSYVLGVFRKYTGILVPDQPHIVLVNPSDMGNLGTIIRTIAGLGIKNLAIIRPAADIWNPKTVRASMGALFRINHEYFPTFKEYARRYTGHKCFPFLLEGKACPEDIPPCDLFSLVFGNEATGLDSYFENIGQSIRLPRSGDVDSFNLAVAVGIGAYEFARINNLV